MDWNKFPFRVYSIEMPFHKKFYVFWNSQKNNYGTIQSVKSTASRKLMIGKGLKILKNSIFKGHFSIISDFTSREYLLPKNYWDLWTPCNCQISWYFWPRVASSPSNGFFLLWIWQFPVSLWKIWFYPVPQKIFDFSSRTIEIQNQATLYSFPAP